jgi:hypothetical protein
VRHGNRAAASIGSRRRTRTWYGLYWANVGADTATARDGGATSDGHSMADFDLAIIGGGITGAGIAREAAGRGIL